MLDRKTAPVHAEVVSFNLPSPEINSLSNGVPIYILRGVTQRVLKIELVFEAGKWFEPKKGLAYFTAHMLEKGTASRSSFEIADFFDRHGASIEISPGFDVVSISLYTLTKNTTIVLPVFLELLTASVFPDNELTLQKDIFNQTLKINNEKTSYVASKLIRQHLFGNLHPYGNAIEASDVDKLGREDLDNFFCDRFSLKQVFVVGSIHDQLLTFITSELQGIQGNSKKQTLPAFTISSDKSLGYIEKPDSIQSSLRLGKRIITRNHKDYPALVLVNHIFGGYFGSRLMKNIREDKWLTYGIYSSLNNLKNDAFFVIAADVNRINKDIAIQEIKSELNLLCQKPVDPQELITAKNHLLGNLQLEIANPFSVIEKIKTIHTFGLNTNFYNSLFLQILHVDELTLQKVANTYLSDSITEVAVG